MLHRPAEGGTPDESKPIDWLIDYLSTRCVEHPELRLVGLLEEGADRKASLAERMESAVKAGVLATTTWVVELAKGKRSNHEVIARVEFTEWVWNARVRAQGQRRGGVEHDAEMDLLWPRHLFEDLTQKQIEDFYGRWPRSAFQIWPQFLRTLEGALDQLATFRWKDRRRQIRREDFVTWFKASPFAGITSVNTGLPLVTANDLWPGPQDLKGLSASEAAARVWSEMYPHGLPKGARIGALASKVNDIVLQRGGVKVEPKQDQRARQALGPKFMKNTRR